MSEYEIAVLFDPGVEVDMTKPTEKVEKIFKEGDGKIVKTDNWGKKKLAYKVAGHEHGVYVIYVVELPAQSVRKVETTLNITDEVIRFLITKVDHKTLAKAEAIRVEKAKKAAERGDRADDDRRDRDDDDDN